MCQVLCFKRKKVEGREREEEEEGREEGKGKKKEGKEEDERGARHKAYLISKCLKF